MSGKNVGGNGLNLNWQHKKWQDYPWQQDLRHGAVFSVNPTTGERTEIKPAAGSKTPLQARKTQQKYYQKKTVMKFFGNLSRKEREELIVKLQTGTLVGGIT